MPIPALAGEGGRPKPDLRRLRWRRSVPESSLLSARDHGPLRARDHGNPCARDHGPPRARDRGLLRARDHVNPCAPDHGLWRGHVRDGGQTPHVRERVVQGGHGDPLR